MKLCSDCFKTLSDKNRMMLISCLQKGKQKVNDLAKQFKIGQPTISYHLAKLRKTKMIKSKKRGREVFYFLNKRYPCLKCNIFNTPKC